MSEQNQTLNQTFNPFKPVKVVVDIELNHLLPNLSRNIEEEDVNIIDDLCLKYGAIPVAECVACTLGEAIVLAQLEESLGLGKLSQDILTTTEQVYITLYGAVQAAQAILDKLNDVDNNKDVNVVDLKPKEDLEKELNELFNIIFKKNKGLGAFDA